jgi:hypothetical protein
MSQPIFATQQRCHQLLLSNAFDGSPMPIFSGSTAP